MDGMGGLMRSLLAEGAHQVATLQELVAVVVAILKPPEISA